MGSSATAPAPALTHSTTLAMSALEGSGLPARVLEGLREFDWNGDGQIDADELHEVRRGRWCRRQRRCADSRCALFFEKKSAVRCWQYFLKRTRYLSIQLLPMHRINTLRGRGALSSQPFLA